MNFLLSSFLFIFSTFSLITNSTVVPLPLPPLLSLRCSPSPSTHHHHNINPIRTLLDNLTSVAVDSRFTTFNTTFRQGRYSGLMQCRPGLRLQACILCASAAGNTILNLCPNSNAVSVWYDGCYVQISMMMMNSSHDRDHDHEGFMDASNHSCSNRAKNQDLARSGPALEALLLKLKADVNLATHHGFSQGEIAYDNINHSDSKIYGAVECVRSLSPQECDFCVGKAIEKLQFYCGGTNGGTAVYGPCLARFDSNEFYYGGIHSAGAGGGNFTVWEGENGGIKRGLVMGYLGGGVACFLVFVLLAFLLRRTVVNIAKVGSLA